MQQYKKVIALLFSLAMLAGLCACSNKKEETNTEGKEYIEQTLNLANNENQEWTYSSNTDAWVLSVVSAVAYPELPEQQGVSVCVPGAYVTGIDTNGDDSADVTSENATEAVKGALVIDYEAKITSTNGRVYTAATAPVVLNTGAAGYGSQSNSAASTSHAADGYINVSCGNRGKQDSVTDEDGNNIYTGDAPSCLVDQKAAARYVKYSILLGNLPGNVDYFVSTGGSGGAHATMFAATGNNSDYYDYQIEAGAVGVYKNSDGSYSTTVTIDGKDYEISDGDMDELPNGDLPTGDLPSGEMPDGGTTQSNTGSGDSANYETYDDMVAAYKADIEEVYAGDEYGNNIVELYNPLNYIGAESTENPTWTKIIMGASEGDISMFNSLNL